jgi:transketolase
MMDIQSLSVNTVRFLAVDGVDKAKSGHPGMPMGCAPIGYLLYKKLMKYNPNNPKWINRDRFVLSAGHGSMLLYSLLHLTGYKLSLDDLKNFRQWASMTPGHPESHITPGVEVTTGPLGQGLANAVGMSVASHFLAATFNKPNYPLFDHYIYVIASDGDMMEGISHEAASFAGHNKLGNLIVFYDNNGITIEGKLSLAMSEDVGKRYEAYGWHVQHVKDVNDLKALEAAALKAKAVTDKPSLIITDTHIGFGSSLQDTAKVHGSPLGSEETKKAKAALGWNYDETFHIPQEVKEHFAEIPDRGSRCESEWNQTLKNYCSAFPDEGKQLTNVLNGDFGNEWLKSLAEFKNYGESMSTRSASNKAINSIAAYLPTFIGGSADLAPSNNTDQKGYASFSADNYAGKNFHFGIREHAMGAILNGMATYVPLIPYGGTFLMFADYMRPSIRLAALSKLRSIFVFTHDSIGVGEDGPTHQPVEHFMALRAIPGLTVIRPADANETAMAWKVALESKDRPVALILTRQNLPILDRAKYGAASGLEKGAYTLKECAGKPECVLVATGSEVYLIVEAAEQLEKEGIKVRAVSMPSWELFEAQTADYKRSVLPADGTPVISVEAGIKQGWKEYTGCNGYSISLDRFGASAPAETVFKMFGFTKENIVAKVKETVKK